MRKFFDKSEWTPHKFPFGLWFRGHSRRGLGLEPRAFRRCLPPPRHKTPGCWDETNVHEHLKLLAPATSRHIIDRSTGSVLCNIIRSQRGCWIGPRASSPPLYLAVKDDPRTDGELIALNAKHLNGQSKTRPTISTADNGHVIIRAEMATTRSLKKLRGQGNRQAGDRRRSC